MKLRSLVIVAVCVFLIACGVDATETPLVPTPTAKPSPTATETQSTDYDISAEALAYLDKALDLMQEHSINREQIDWDALRSQTYRRARGARTSADTYQALQDALEDLGDNHSFFMTPEYAAQMDDGTLNAHIPDPSGELLYKRLGYVSVPAFAGNNKLVEHAMTIQNIIQDLDAQAPCGWVLDLRENMGGNMWPMLAGVGPLLGEGLAGAFVAPDGSEIAWHYVNGQAIEGDKVLVEINGDDVYTLDKPLPPVAVLTGPHTSSSGEAIVVSFQGRPDTRSFGQATSGRSTANEQFVLSDGASLVLTVAWFADRTGQIYGEKIVPDQVVNQQGQDDPTIQTAADWLLDQPACATGQ